jgi:predicted metal-dependent enzyme (double-stranded beta helix superfamily)
MPASQEAYSVADLVGDLRRIVAATADDREIVRQVMPLARRLGGPALRRDEFYECDPEQGFGINILHEEPDHSLLVEAIAWLPGRGVKPHNHKTWGVVIGLDGRETNVNWRRRDDGTRQGYADLVAHHEVVVGPSSPSCRRTSTACATTATRRHCRCISTAKAWRISTARNSIRTPRSSARVRNACASIGRPGRAPGSQPWLEARMRMPTRVSP